MTDELERAIKRLLADPRAVDLHIHFAAPACYAARVERVRCDGERLVPQPPDHHTALNSHEFPRAAGRSARRHTKAVTLTNCIEISCDDARRSRENLNLPWLSVALPAQSITGRAIPLSEGQSSRTQRRA